ncbi:MAG: F0F1 ATP synthase subunit alpha [Rickettsia sp.]|nr:F0F1 ATP synthase subunit alpha [Rickettsia sp.]
MSYNVSEFSEILKKEISELSPLVELQEIGYVLRVGDGVAFIYGMQNVEISEKIEFESGVLGMAINLERDVVGAIIMGDDSQIKQGDKVFRKKHLFDTIVGEELIGRVIDVMGNALDGGKNIVTDHRRNIEVEAPSVISRKPIHQPLQTGIKIIDALIPIGKGQRELIIGDRQTGKTSIAIDTIINQKNVTFDKRVICVYVAIGQKKSSVARLLEALRSSGAMEHSIVVATFASDPVAMQFIAPYIGCSIGEYFRDNSKDALVVYDDLSKHAVAYRQISLLLRRPPGREAYPGDIFFIHSRLLERAAKLSEEFGGGSLTALPIIETQEGDISSYIPTNVISITDGQIFLESELFNKSIRPAVNIGNSVSRVGSASQVKAIKSLVGSMKLELAQFRELESFMQFSSSLDEKTQNSLENGLKLMELLKQDNFSPLNLEEQVIVLFIANKGFLKNIELVDIKKFEKSLFEHLKMFHPSLLQNIAQLQEVTPEIEENLNIFLNNFIKETWNLIKNQENNESK